MPDELETASATRPPESSAVMTEAELAEAKRYGRMELICTLVDKTVDLSYLAVAAFFLAKPLDEWLMNYSWLERYASLRLLALFAAVTLLHIAVSLPFSFYSGFLLEHQFKLSTLTFGGWLWRYLKRNLLGLALGSAMMLGLYWLIWTTGSWWWLAAAGAFFLVSVILGQLAPVLILPLFYKIEKLDASELTDRIAKLAAGTGLSIEGVYRMDLSEETVKANAMLAGLGRTRRVLMGDTLLNGFTPDEIEVIFAHEIGHHVFRHIRKMILAGILYSAAGFWICDAILRLAVAKEIGAADIYANLPVWTLPLLMFAFSVFAQLLEPLQNAVSRHYERQSDRYALECTGRREAYLSAFRKLAKLNKDDPHPHWLEVFLFHSHPPIGERLARAEGEC
jgi:STE24 endopeptidase